MKLKPRRFENHLPAVLSESHQNQFTPSHKILKIQDPSVGTVQTLKIQSRANSWPRQWAKRYGNNCNVKTFLFW